MWSLVVVLWGVYASECLARLRPTQCLFRGRRAGALRLVARPDVQLWQDRIGLAWLPLLPTGLALVSDGDAFDLEGAHQDFARIQEDGRALALAALVLFVLLLPGLSFLLVTERFLASLWIWGPSTACAWSLSVVLFFRTWRQRYGGWPDLDTALAVLLSPLGLVRAPIVATLPALRRVHPVVLAALACDDGEFLRVARLWHFDRVDLRDRIERVAAGRGLLAPLLEPPRPTEGDLLRYCPRCHTAYRDAAQRCADCTDVNLVRLPVEDHRHAGAAEAS